MEFILENCFYLGTKSFDSKKGDKLHLATFTAEGLGSFELFVEYPPTLPYMSGCSLTFEVRNFNNKLNLALKGVN